MIILAAVSTRQQSGSGCFWWRLANNWQELQPSPRVCWLRPGLANCPRLASVGRLGKVGSCRVAAR